MFVKKKYPDVDQGWAWVVMVTCYLGFFLSCVTLFMRGVVYVELLEKFQEGNAKTSLLGAICSGVLCIASPVASGFINTFGCRTGIVAGGVILAVSNFISGFMPNLDGLIFSAGFMSGIGYSLSGAGLVVSLGYYFDRFRNKTISGIFLVVGFGLFVSSPLGLWALDVFGLSGTFLIAGCINAQLCVAGMLCRPSSLEKESLAERSRGDETTCWQKLTKGFDVALLKKRELVLFLLSIASWNFAFSVAVGHLPNFMKRNGSTEAEVVVLMTALSIANTFGRFAGHILSSFNLIDRIHIHSISLALGGLLSALSPLYSGSATGKIAFAIQLGIFVGIPNVLMTVITIRLSGMSTVSEAHGFSYLACGIGVLIGPFIAGFVVDLTGAYVYSLVIVGIVMLAGSLCSHLAYICERPTDDVNVRDIAHPQETEDIQMLTNYTIDNKDCSI